jgi:hypothetical protein
MHAEQHHAQQPACRLYAAVRPRKKPELSTDILEPFMQGEVQAMQGLADLAASGCARWHGDGDGEERGQGQKPAPSCGDIAGQGAAADDGCAQEHRDGATWSHRDARCQFSRLNWRKAVQRQQICLLAHLLLVRWPLLLCSGALGCCHLATHKCHISITCSTDHEAALCGMAESLGITCQHAQGPCQT